MIKIKINNSTSKVEGLTRQQINEVRREMSYIEEKGRGFSSRAGFRRYLMGLRGDFPTGLMPILLAWANKNNLKIITLDNRKKPEIKSGRFRLSL